MTLACMPGCPAARAQLHARGSCPPRARHPLPPAAPADNIPGVAGVGPKTAQALLQQHGSLEALLRHAAEVKPKRAAAQLMSGKPTQGAGGRLAGALLVRLHCGRLLVRTLPPRRAAAASSHSLPGRPRVAAAEEGRAAALLSQQLVRIETALDLPPLQAPLDSLRCVAAGNLRCWGLARLAARAAVLLTPPCPTRRPHLHHLAGCACRRTRARSCCASLRRWSSASTASASRRCGPASCTEAGSVRGQGRHWRAAALAAAHPSSVSPLQPAGWTLLHPPSLAWPPTGIGSPQIGAPRLGRRVGQEARG